MCTTKQAAYRSHDSFASSVQSAGTAANKYISVANDTPNGDENEEESTSSWEWFTDEEDFYVDIVYEPPRRQESLLLDSLDLVRPRRRSLSFEEMRRDHDRLRFETDSFDLARAPRRVPQSKEAEEQDCDSSVYQEEDEETELPLNDEVENLQNPQEALLSPRAKRTKPRRHRHLEHDYIPQFITSE